MKFSMKILILLSANTNFRLQVSLVDRENFALSFRLGEAYLNLAEAAAHNNDESTALSALKTLLAKRYEPDKFVEPTGLTGDALKTFIKNERRKRTLF